MAESLGTIRGQLNLDVKQALAAYTSARAAHVSTVTALHTGAGAMIASGTAIAGVGTIMAAGLIAAVGAAAQFEKKLDYFAAVSGTVGKEFDAVKAKAIQLGQDTIYSANQIADSFVELGKSGVSAQQIIGGVGEAVAALGSAADLPLDVAANIITAAVATFSLSADKAVDVANKLAGAANASIIDVTDLGTSLKYAGGTAAALGVPFGELNTALAVLGTYGIKGSTAGTGLRTILLGLSGSTPKATQALKDLGIITADGANKFFDATGKAKPLSEVFGILQKATNGLTNEQKVQTLRTIFQNRALAAAIDLTKAGSEGFDKMAAAIDKTTAADVAAKRLDNLSGDIEILKGNIDTLAITAGGSLQSFARSAVQAATSIIGAFSNIPKELQTTILIFTAVGAGLFILVGTFGIFAGSILNLIALGIQLRQAYVLIKDSMLAFRAALLAVTVAQWLLNAAQAANPIGIVIVAILALVAAMIWFFTQTKLGREVFANIVKFITEAWANIQKFTTEAIANIIAFVSANWPLLLTIVLGPLGAIIAWIIQNWGSIVGVFQTVINAIVTGFQAFVSFFVNLWINITTGVQNFITGFVSFFVNLPGQIVAILAALPGQLGYIIGFAIGFMIRLLIDFGTWIIVNIPIIIGNIITFFAELPGKIGQFFVDLGTAIFNALMAIGTWIVTNVPIIITNMINFFVALPGQIGAFFVALWNNIISTLLSMGAAIGSFLGQMINNIISFFVTLPTRVVAFFVDMYNGAVRIVHNVVSALISFGTDAYNAIKNGIQGIPALVKGIFDKVFSAIKGVVSSAFKAMKDFAAGLWNGFKDGLGIHSPSYIEHAMWAITGVIETETGTLKKQVRTLQGLGNGITKIGNDIGNNFGSNMSSGVADLYAQVAGIQGLQASVALGTTGGVGGSSPADALASIASSLDTIKDQVGAPQYDIVVNNPTAEPTSQSLPSAIRKTSYMNK